MIGRLTGTLAHFRTDSIIIDVMGVGYLVHVSHTARNHLYAAHLNDPQARHTLFIETYVREDQFTLFGFLTEEEQTLFGLLTTVQGVGNKMALNLLGQMPPAQLAHAILAQDKASLQRAQGVGARLAERICSELKNKIMHLEGIMHAPATPTDPPAPTPKRTSKKPPTPTPITPFIADDAIAALTQLGYDRSRAYEAAHKAMRNHEGAELSVELLVKEALRLL
ncbi:MAG: Holliday junction branch migration protein RuvA [Alphaproteobacteria bacterium]|nr:MAG: Holliday junction branch migration protein RuvA [Alphaproteobacteria bacterium]